MFRRLIARRMSASQQSNELTCQSCSRPAGPPDLDGSLKVLTLWLLQARLGQRISVHVNGCPMSPCICRPLFTLALVGC